MRERGLFRSSVLCGAVPVGLGVLAIPPWVALGADVWLGLWFVSVYLGLIALPAGLVLLALSLRKRARDPGIRGRRRALRAAGSVGLLLVSFPLLPLFAFWVASHLPTTVRPPAVADAPALVAVIDYGDHSSLVLPADGHSVEFSFGDWNYYALNKQDAWTGVAAVTWPTPGTLGRRDLPGPHDPARLERLVRCEQVLAVPVSRDRAARLLAKLEERFQAGGATALWNPTYGLTFVQDPESYVSCNNCNHAVASWLRELGCEVRHAAGFSDFKLVD